MKVVRAGLVVFAAFATLGQPLAAQDPKVEVKVKVKVKVQPIAHPDDLVRIEVPASWKIEDLKFQKLTPEHKAHNVTQFKVSVGAGNLAYFSVVVIFPTRLRPLDQAWYEATSREALALADLVGVYADPMPHIVWIDKKYPKEYRIVTFDRQRTRGVHLICWCRKEKWQTLKPVFFRIAKSATVKFGPWLKPPEDRKLTMLKDVGYSAGKGVGAAELKQVQKTVDAVFSRLEKIHGPRWSLPDEPLTVYVNALRSEHAKLDGVGDRLHDVMGSCLDNRILTIPLDRPDANLPGIFADRIAGIFLRQTYGETALWMVQTEEFLAEMAAATGKKLPTVTKEFHDSLVPAAMTFEKAVRPNDLVYVAKRSLRVSYVALFHIGPSKYRRAYRAFLAELRETCDGETALVKHLLSLDQEKMRKAAATIIKRLKPFKKKKKS